MAKYSILQNFYASSKWRSLRFNLIMERSNSKGIVICEKCKKPILKPIDVHGHHKIELTPENVNDYSISLNPDNIELICHECHDKEHHRFGYRPSKRVYLVYGPPMSGKSTFVKENMERGDLVIDMDKLYKAISLQSNYDKPDNLLMNVIGVRNLLIDNVKTRYGKWYNAWIVGGYADKYKREMTADALGAELVYMDVSKEECYSRLKQDEERQYRIKEWQEYIDRWFQSYSV
ncbi:HNH endonuclease [Clostridium felsineum]|uniref:Uncharacterized protein n=1 Tax=Clostridium felsineum TaxID=36839 RepID=A0A1S8L020_9CLOT|nr:HNH endonuclease [Clostridium felsineum]URZ06478.1 hypothetical protein CLROS_018110 [Clostridium felsineum]URZ11513.1 hypothetical protein CROST_022300 [Clostridium felsineum]